MGAEGKAAIESSLEIKDPFAPSRKDEEVLNILKGDETSLYVTEGTWPMPELCISLQLMPHDNRRESGGGTNLQLASNLSTK